jgi:hypothetical protein
MRIHVVEKKIRRRKQTKNWRETGVREKRGDEN